MRWPWIPLRAVVPVVLIGLLALLATLQYRWMGKVSEAERAQMSRSLSVRAGEFTADFNRELTRLYTASQAMQATDGSLSWATFADSLDRWRAGTRFPNLVRTVYLAEWPGGAPSLRRWNAATRAFAAEPMAAWPSSLATIRQRFAQGVPPTLATARLREPAPSTPRASNTVITVTMTPLAVEVPALVVHVGAMTSVRLSSASRGSVNWFELGRTAVILELDAEYLKTVVLPALVERHFPRGSEPDYRVAVLDEHGSSLLTRGLAAGAPLGAERADEVAPFFALQFDNVPGGVPELEALGQSIPPPPPPPLATTARGASASPSPGRDAGVGAPGAAPGDADAVASAPSSRAGQDSPMQWSSAEGPVIARYSLVVESRKPGGSESMVPAMPLRRVNAQRGWTLLLQHGSGSLDAAVRQVRLRNLWVSFGILSVLAAGVLLVMANARRSEQLAARQMEFVATVSHELRTPLAVIRSAAQNLAAGVVAEPAQARRYGDLIETEGRRLTDMVEQVLDYAGLEGRRGVRDPRPVDIGAVVEVAAAACRPACEVAGCTLDVSIETPDDRPPMVSGDDAALGRVVANLVTNAAKHGGDGRWVGVSVRTCAVQNGHEVLVTVSDRGRGLESGELAHIFEPFRRGRHAVERQVHGNGLGLSLVKRVVEAHGGRVAVLSVPGQGATFVVYLPAIGETAGDAEEGAA